ncbi:hypothetical protein ACNPQM_24000 [Streptomyces sp. NPDC056231]|uniref:hypothetical protein n=1 Tax=Streptomyces sp. NPDC056231 TaxID=3345755 RepID=UPI003AAA380B
MRRSAARQGRCSVLRCCGSGSSAGLFGTRAQLADKPFARSVGAVVGIYGLPEEEAWYGRWTVAGRLEAQG